MIFPTRTEASSFCTRTRASSVSPCNLQSPKGVEIAKRLVALVDIVVENFSPGVMARLGLSYEELKKIKPDIIMASSSIYGQTGPKKRFAGFGNTGYAISGHWPLVGWPDRNPVWPGIAYADAQQPIFTTIAILAAIDYRRRTGKGQLIDITQAETMVQLISPPECSITLRMAMFKRAWVTVPRMRLPTVSFPVREMTGGALLPSSTRWSGKHFAV